MPCSDTENGSASTACSSLTPAGTGMHIDSCAGTRGAKPPVALLLLPLWMPGGRMPRAQRHPVGGGQLGLGQLGQPGRRERAEEEALVDPAEQARHYLARDAQLAHERAHARYQSRPARGNQAACRAGSRSGTMAAVARSEASNPRRAIPSVESLLQAPAGTALAARWRRGHVGETTRAVLAEIRRAPG